MPLRAGLPHQGLNKEAAEAGHPRNGRHQPQGGHVYGPRVFRILFVADLFVGLMDVPVISKIFTHISPICYSNTRDATEGWSAMPGASLIKAKCSGDYTMYHIVM